MGKRGKGREYAPLGIGGRGTDAEVTSEKIPRRPQKGQNDGAQGNAEGDLEIHLGVLGEEIGIDLKIRPTETVNAADLVQERHEVLH